MIRWNRQVIAPPALQGHGSAERKVTWSELFYDLTFVVAVNQLATTFSEDLSWRGFGSFVLLFLPVWWAWVGQTFYLTRFDSDDLVHQALTAIKMFFVVCMSFSIPQALGAQSHVFVLSYAAIRTLLVVDYLRVSRHVPQARVLAQRYAAGFGLAVMIWLASLAVPISVRPLFWLLAIALDFAVPFTAGRYATEIPPRTHHLPERFGLFTIIVIGESVAANVIALQNTKFSVSTLITAALGWLIIYFVWHGYFNGVRGAESRSIGDRSQARAFRAWMYLHVSLTIGVVTSAILIKKAIQFPTEAVGPVIGWLTVLSGFLGMHSLYLIFLTTPQRTCTGLIRKLLRPHGWVNAIYLVSGLWVSGWSRQALLIWTLLAWGSHFVLTLREEVAQLSADHHSEI